MSYPILKPFSGFPVHFRIKCKLLILATQSFNVIRPCPDCPSSTCLPYTLAQAFLIFLQYGKLLHVSTPLFLLFLLPRTFFYPGLLMTHWNVTSSEWLSLTSIHSHSLSYAPILFSLVMLVTYPKCSFLISCLSFRIEASWNKAENLAMRHSAWYKIGTQFHEWIMTLHVSRANVPLFKELMVLSRLV